MKPIAMATLRAAVALACVWALAVLPLHVPLALAQQAAPPKPRVAVLEFEGVGVTPAESAAVTDQLRSDLVRLRTFTVLDRAQTESVLKEMALQQTGVTQTDQAARIGRMLNVQFIITGRITALEGAYQVNAQMVNVETTEIERSDSIVYQGHILGLLQQNIGTMAARLSETSAAPVSPLAQEDKGWPWWVWALIGVGVIAAAAAAGGGGGEEPPACPSPSGCGTLPVSW
jgi:TolB-like protein